MNKNIFIGTFFSGAIIILTSFLTFNPFNIFLNIFLIFLFTFYSVPPLRFKAIPFLGVLASAMIYYSIMLIPLTYSSLSFVDILSKTVWVFVFLFGTHLYFEAVDIESDKKAGIKTTAVLLGRRVVSIICCFCSLFKVIFYPSNNFFINLIFVLFASMVFYAVYKNSQKTDNQILIVANKLGSVVLLLFILQTIFSIKF